MTGGSRVQSHRSHIEVEDEDFDKHVDRLEQKYLKYTTGYSKMSKGKFEADKARVDESFELELQQTQNHFKLERFKAEERAKLSDYEAELKRQRTKIADSRKLEMRMKQLELRNMQLQLALASSSSKPQGCATSKKRKVCNQWNDDADEDYDDHGDEDDDEGEDEEMYDEVDE